MEAGLIRNLMYEDQKAGLRRVLPVVLPGCSPNDIPLWLLPASASYYRVSEFTVSGAEKLLRVLTGQPSEIEPPLGIPPVLPTRSGPASRISRASTLSPATTGTLQTDRTAGNATGPSASWHHGTRSAVRRLYPTYGRR